MNFKSPIDLTNGSTMGGNALAVQVNHYTKTELQTSGSSQVHFGNLTNVPTSFTPAVHDHDDRYYTESESDAKYLGISAKAADSNLLDGIDSSGFARAGARTDNYIWMRRNAADSVGFFTQQGTGDILRFYKGAGDGTQLTAIDNSGNFTGNAATASKWLASRTITLTGDITATISIDGSGDVSVATTYKNSGVTAGTYRSVTVDAKGNVTAGTNPTTLAGYGITDAASSGHTHTFASLTSKPTTLAGYGITDAASSGHNHTVASLSDTTITTPASGQVLSWDGTKWVNYTLTAGNIPDGTTSAKGVVQLSTATNSTSTTLAATPSAVKAAYDLAAGKADAGHTHSYIPLSGSTAVTGDIHFTDSGTALRGIQGTMGANDFWRVKGGATATDAGYLEIATADGATEPIYVRQYTGAFATLSRTLTLLDSSGNTSIPGNLSVGGSLDMGNDPIQNVTQITGQYGTIAKSTDEWLRINDDGSHASGIYFGSSTTRTDGELQVGSSGASFKANSSGVTIQNKVQLQYNATENSLDFVFI